MSSPRSRPATRKPQSSYQRGEHLYRRGKVWYARGGILGREGESLHTRDAAEAGERLRALVARRRAELDGRAPADRGRAARLDRPEATLAAAVAAWVEAPHGYTRRTLDSHETRLLAWVTWCAGRGITLASQATHELVDRWLTDRSASVSRRTINRDLRAVRVCLRWCAARALVPQGGPWVERKELREPTRSRRRDVPDPDELTRVLERVTVPRYRLALRALAATGLRIEELRRLHPTDLRDGRLHVEPEGGAADTAEPTKGYRARSIPLAPVAAAAVAEYLAVARQSGAGHPGRPPSERRLLTALHAACDAAEVPRCGLHDLRRAFATEAFRSGVPLTVIAQWLGHADVRTTEGYVVGYRSDREHVAPVPRALAGAESVQSPGAHADSRGPSGRHLRIAR